MIPPEVMGMSIYCPRGGPIAPSLTWGGGLREPAGDSTPADDPYQQAWSSPCCFLGKAAEDPRGLLLTLSLWVPLRRPDIPEARLLLGDRTAPSNEACPVCSWYALGVGFDLGVKPDLPKDGQLAPDSCLTPDSCPPPVYQTHRPPLIPLWARPSCQETV